MVMIRAMLPSDVPFAHAIRLRVRENRLSDPSVVTEQDYHDFMARDTMSWVHQLDGAITGFVMVDVEKQNLWALFVAPEHEGTGIGRALNDVMLARYFQRCDRLSLSTDPDTRAAEFYRKAGYIETGETANGREIIFAISRSN